MAAFAIPKNAVRILSQSLARELAPDNIHVSHLIIDGLTCIPRGLPRFLIGKFENLGFHI
mgnify:CR=1 FL=1